MLTDILIGFSIIGVTVLIHAFGTSGWINYLLHRFSSPVQEIRFMWFFPIILSTALFLIILHIIEILIWAIVYQVLPRITEIKLFEEAVYFSMVTYTTLGYGDITLGSDGRILCGLEALNGVLLIGWSTALFFSVLQNIFRMKDKEDKIAD